MSQANPLADLSAKTSSSLAGVLSQLDASFGNNFSSRDLFSTLLSQNSDLDYSLAALPTEASQNLSVASNTSFTVTNSTNSTLQSLNDLSTNLNRVLDALNKQKDQIQSTSQQTQNNNASTSMAGSGTQNVTTGSTNTSVPANTKETDQTDQTTSDAQTSSQSTSDAQNIASVLAQLLLLTQMMVKRLQQIEKMAAGSQSSGASSLTSAGGASAASSNPLAQLIAALEKTAQSLQETAAQNSVNDTNSLSPAQLNDLTKVADNFLSLIGGTSAQSPTLTNTSDLTSQLAELDAKLKTTLAELQTQNISTTQKVQDTSVSTTNSVSVATWGGSVVPATQPKSVASEEEKEKSLSSATALTADNTPSASMRTFVASEAATLSADKGGDTEDRSFTSDMFSNNKNSTFVNNPNSNINAEGAQATGTYSFASTLSATRAALGGATGLPSVVDQVILQMNRSVKSGNDQMSLQLQPGDLGKITVKLDFGSDGKVQGTVTADNPQTLSMLQKDSRSLERALQDAGLRADPGSLQFNLGGQSGQNTGQMAQNNNASTPVNGTVSANTLDDTGLIELGTNIETYYVTPTGVNIQV